MIGKYDIKKGDKVKYTCYSIGGEPIVVDNIYVRDISSGNYPVVDLSNGHEAQWDGEKYVIHDLNDVELVKIPSLVKARNCNGCWAYETYGWKRGLCTLGFDVEQLGNNCTQGSYRGDYWSFYCKPKEPCMKPKTGKQYAAAMSARHRRQRSV